MKNDILLDIATGQSRKTTYWKNTEMLWSVLVNRLRETHRTAETVAEYAAATKARQDEIKDIGGFVGGLLAKGRRKPEAVQHRSLLTLDMDTAPLRFWETFTSLNDFAACIYSTHKHSESAPRLRLLIPLDRTVNPTEYEAIGRRIAGQLGIEGFDHTGFQPYRLMYWPSTSKDGVYEFEVQDGDLLNCDEVLATYQDYTDSSQWPVSVKVGARMDREIKKQGDPLAKRGLVGAFCRAYNIHDAIGEFLPDVYEPVAGDDENGRYTYLHGSTAGGLVTYDSLYSYSHHGTDPISGKLCNAFDLVRIHLYGDKDEKVNANTSGNNLPSYKAMIEFARDLDAVKLQWMQDKRESIIEDFGRPDDSQAETVIQTVNRQFLGLPAVPAFDDSDAALEWIKTLEVEPKGGAKGTYQNLIQILKNDPWLKGRFAFDAFRQFFVVLGALPWQAVTQDAPVGRIYSDRDDAALRGFIETTYGINSPLKLKDCCKQVFGENVFHPVRNYLNSLEWDGEPRLDSILSDYFGTETNEYTAAIGRKWFTAAVARIFEPGVKFDYTLTLVGTEGIYKSTFFRKLADPWFSDNFSFHMVGSKQAVEQITGYWLVEIGELTGLKRAELEGVKAFLVRQKDIQRGAFKENLTEFKRQNVFAGSTNDDTFLKGSTGNRRFWVVQTMQQEPVKKTIELDSERDQIWSEAVHFYRAGESLFLSKKLEDAANEVQELHTEKDDRFDTLKDFLDIKITADWDSKDIHDKRDFLRGGDLQPAGTVRREKITVTEIWAECFQGSLKEINSFNTKFIHDIMRKIGGWKKGFTRVNGQLKRGYFIDTYADTGKQ